jgi:WD40 repeat protein
MTVLALVWAVVLGLVINEFSELSPWAARKVVRWSARVRYTNPRRARARAEELSALIDARPGKLLKLITALCFAAAAIRAWLARAVTNLTVTELRVTAGGALALNLATTASLALTASLAAYDSLAPPARPTVASQAPSFLARAEPALLTRPTTPVFTVAFSPDGQYIAAATGNGTVQLWDVSDPLHHVTLGNPLTAAGPPGDTLDGTVAWGPGGRLAAGTAGGGIGLWNTADARHPVAVQTPPSALTTAIQNLAFDSTGRMLAAASTAGTIELWDTATPTRPQPLAVIRDFVSPGPGQDVFAVSISCGDRVLAAADADGSVRLWNITDPSHPRPLGGPQPLASLTSPVYQVTFSPDGSLLAASGADGKVRLWQVADPAHPRLLATLTGPQGIVYDVAFSPDGHTLATSDGDKTIWLWDITDPARPASLGPLTGPAAPVFSAVFSPTGRALIAGSQDGTVRLWLSS